MLKICDLNVSFGRKQVLKNINITIKPHAFTVIIGKNGSGKSTLVSAVNGTADYTGSILFSNQDLRLIPPKEKAKLISVLPQTLPLPHITVEELVKMGRSPYVDIGRRFTDTDTKAVEDALAAVGISHMRSDYTDCLSGGERQKAYLALILAQQTRLLILDEPATYMDVEYERQLMDTLAELKSSMHKTVIAVMHNLNMAVRYAQWIVVMDKGTVIFEGTTEECLEKQIIEQVFNVKKHMADGEIFFC